MQYDSIHEMESDVVELGSDIVQPDSEVFEMGSDVIEMGSDVIEFIGDSSVDANGYVEPQRADATVEVDAMDESMDFFDEVPLKRSSEMSPNRSLHAGLFHTLSPSRARPQRAEPSLKSGQVRQIQAGERQPVRHEERGGEAIVDFNEQATSVLPDEIQTARPAPAQGQAGTKQVRERTAGGADDQPRAVVYLGGCFHRWLRTRSRR